MLIPELQMGGAAKVVRELSQSLRTGMDVVEAVFNAADGIDFPGEQPVSLGVSGGGGPAGKIANLVRRVDRARKLKRSLDVDVSISHLEGAHWVDVLSRGREKIVLCVHGSIVHNGDVRGLSGWLRSRVVLPLIYNRAERIVTVSHDLASELMELGVDADRITTINNGFDLDRIERLAAEPLTGAEAELFYGPPVLVTAGRLAEQKNHRALLDVFAAVRRRRPVRLLIAGDGPLRSDLLAQATALGLAVGEPWSGARQTGAADVTFLGVQENPFRFIARSDIYVMTSGWEGFPLALCEAMACGTAVVATDCPTGPREILAPERAPSKQPVVVPQRTSSGVLMPLLHLPSRDLRAKQCWVELLDELLADSAQREELAAAGRQRVHAFDRRVTDARWEELLAGLVQPPSATLP